MSYGKDKKLNKKDLEETAGGKLTEVKEHSNFKDKILKKPIILAYGAPMPGLRPKISIPDSLKKSKDDLSFEENLDKNKCKNLNE